MAVRAYDAAIRADQTGWGTASDGNTWGFTGAGSTNSVVSNELVMKANSASDTFAQLGSTSIADQEIICRLAIGTGDIAAVLGRFASAGTFCYKLIYFSGAIHINKTVSGSGSNLANSGAFSLTAGTFYWFKFRLQGSNLSGKVWLADGTPEPNAWTLTATDSSIASGGFALLGNVNSAGGVQYDHFLASSLNNEISNGYGGMFS